MGRITKEALNIIPLGLFLLGIIFLLIGWRWQSPRSEENVVVLKGLAYLKSEIVRVQDQVYVLEDELVKTKQLFNNRPEIQTAVDEPKKVNQQELDLREHKHQEVEQKEGKRNYVELKKAKLYSIISQEQRERTVKASKRQLEEKTSMQQASDSTPQVDQHNSRKYREVLELATQGQSIPEISQRLFISQDAVRMVLSMQLKGGA